MSTKTIYVSIGNSDDRLTQTEWAAFTDDLHMTLANLAEEIHGVWFSAPDAPYQNMCVCLELEGFDETDLRGRLVELTVKYRQDSIAWAEVPHPEFLRNPTPPVRTVVNIMPDPLANGGPR